METMVRFLNYSPLLQRRTDRFPCAASYHYYDPSSSILRQCNEWVNFSSFLARCIASGINDSYKDGYELLKININEALEKDHPPGIYRDCWIMVAAQYILLAGEAIYKQMISSAVKGSDSERRGLDKWRLWANMFGKRADEEDSKSEANSAAFAAYQKMVSLHPELFLVS
jgi:Protein of unknown function (DUF3632)